MRRKSVVLCQWESSTPRRDRATAVVDYFADPHHRQGPEHPRRAVTIITADYSLLGKGKSAAQLNITCPHRCFVPNTPHNNCRDCFFLWMTWPPLNFIEPLLSFWIFNAALLSQKYRTKYSLTDKLKKMQVGHTVISFIIFYLFLISAHFYFICCHMSNLGIFMLKMRWMYRTNNLLN